jgi:hypothetical protein
MKVDDNVMNITLFINKYPINKGTATFILHRTNCGVGPKRWESQGADPEKFHIRYFVEMRSEVKW